METQMMLCAGRLPYMPALLAQTDIAVLLSYHEGVPNSLLEAAACGLPLVTTDVPGCCRIVKHDANGLLVPSRDSTTLAAAIRRLCLEPETRQRLGLASR